MNAKPLYLHTLSPLHVGTGRGTGLVDLPIAREKATHYPMVPGSAIKGVIRDAYERDNAQMGKDDLKKWINVWFGDTSDSSAQAGSLLFGDAYLLLMPVRAFRGTFAWVTCPAILKRHKRDLNLQVKVPEVEGNKVLTHSEATTWGNGPVILEDLDLVKSNPVPETDAWFALLATNIFADPVSDCWEKAFKERFLIVSDDTFDFLCEFGTEVRARVRLTEEKTVAKGALWYEESLPAEAILAGLIWEDEHYSKKSGLLGLLASMVHNKELQFGGKATTGNGRVVLKVGA